MSAFLVCLCGWVGVGHLYSSLPFCDRTLAFEARAKDLVSRLSSGEKLGKDNVTSTPLSNYASALPSVGVNYYQWWSEALHGVASSPGVTFSGDTPSATSFPQVCLKFIAYPSDVVRDMFLIKWYWLAMT